MENDPGNNETLKHIPIPWMFLIAYLIGFGVQLFIPISISSTILFDVTQVIGVLFILGGLLLAVWAQYIFRRIRTTTVPGKTSSTLVTWGPYRFSRNPMYVGLFLLFVGIRSSLRSFGLSFCSFL